ncbi:hypothetical protein A3B85_00965 [Candidatus Nomurabacteria bacterium RIFCSPHIGHO2_02_FULL_37_13]|uniref:L-threonylcarbamoyladenylate synthase n=1 Tax=Candidatus Nomurabacteria bacterium RIFCSPHIGHO2_02_FULL_37_13 TaxID=1801750 RepID=A0A1F6W491_9BACT|nr:MAG: hypothetical protein A2640_02650 [Candidatus Nomurabacteria bacterium RIFCSPHIGHO2_01_FULL_36_23]OGI76622.1 MAG: hypothetical protein A3B85_00965 [Candidatus Nomurabacteria bacterium RIFCSPHIGHO2_02_FULL_37_13]OGI87515.1 MAG: hypothetical protein A2906_00990 [Candidatus Nomurabacteria bacterium RIFCSPLOWO2_01_FULL_37_25]
MVWNDEKLIKTLEENGVVVMPTDTLYGIVGRALNASVVDRIYTIRKRNTQKPCIILICDMEELKKFGIILTKTKQKEIEKYKEPTSFIVDCENEKFKYLHRGINTLAFRIPVSQSLRNLLIKVGPLLVPSANPEGLLPAKNIAEAKKYFGDLVNFYVDGGELTGKPSKIIKLHKDGSASIIRE